MMMMIRKQMIDFDFDCFFDCGVREFENLFLRYVGKLGDLVTPVCVRANKLALQKLIL